MNISLLISLSTALAYLPFAASAQDHVHADGSSCSGDHDHPAEAHTETTPHVHADGSSCSGNHDHPAEAHAETTPHVHADGSSCSGDHDHPAEAHAETTPHVHADGSSCSGDHDHPAEAHAETTPHVHADGSSCSGDHGHTHDGKPCTGEEVVIVEADARSRHILNMQMEEVPATSNALTHSLYGYLSTPEHGLSTYALPCSGRMTIHVKSAQQVKKGDLLYTLESPMLTEQLAACDSVEANLERCTEELRAMEARLARLAEAGTRNSDLEEQRTFKLAEQRQLQRDLQTARTRLRSLTLGGELTERQGLQVLVVKASKDGIVRNVGVTQGSWGEQGSPVITMSDTSALEIVGSLYAGNMPRFNQVRATIPVGRNNLTVTGTWRLAEQVDPEKMTRTLYFTPDSLPADVPVGQLCRLDLYDDTVAAEGNVSIPDSAIVKVGVDDVVFAEVGEGKFAMLKVQAGTSSRGMTPVKGLKPGQRIVVKGGYELKYVLPGEGQKKKAGHFHADGKFHEGDDH